MDMRYAVFIAALAAGLTPLLAHHGGQGFDQNKVVSLSGKVVRVEWINPHIFLHLAVTGQNGKQTEWLVEGSSPGTLEHKGFHKESLKEGTAVVVEGHPATSRDNTAMAKSITLPDGRKISTDSGLVFSRDGSQIIFKSKTAGK